MFEAVTAMLMMAAQASAGPATRVDDLAWMSGRWETRAGENWTEEQWSEPRAGVMLGFSRTGAGGTMGEFEFIRLQAGPDGAPVYMPQPGGGPPVSFRLVARDGTSATFENRSHDYPQRITYRRSGNVMVATVSLADGSRPISWTFRRRR
jgi:hypothetical protein